MKKLLLVLLLVATSAFAQAPQYGRFYKTLVQTAAPSQPCQVGTLLFSTTENSSWICPAGTWQLVGKDVSHTATPTHSYQPVSTDFNIGATSGKNVADGTAFLAPAMFNAISTNMTKTGNYVGALIGHYNVSGTNATHYPSGAILAGIGDGTTTAKGAVVAYIDGDSSLTTAGAAFKVMSNNSTAASHFDYGLDLADASHDGFIAVSYAKASIRLSNNAHIFTGAQTTRSGLRTEVDAKVTHTGVAIGSLYLSTAGKLYIKTADAGADTDWQKVTSTAAD